MFSSLKRTLKFILIAFIAVVFVTFSVVNREFVDISLFPLPYSATMPKFILAMLCFVFGFLFSWVALSLKITKSNHALKTEHNKVVALQNEVSALNEQRREHVPVLSSARQ